MHVSHTAIWVADLDASTAFYEGVLGLTHQWDFTHDGVVNYYVGTGDSAQLQFKYDPEKAAVDEPAGIDHVAVGVDDVDRTFDRVVEESDCSVVLEPTDFTDAGRRAAFVTDPDGYTVELVATI